MANLLNRLSYYLDQHMTWRDFVIVVVGGNVLKVLYYLVS